MQREVIMMLDFRYDEGARPRKELICPCITTRGGCNESVSGVPLVIEKWTQSESNKQQSKDISSV